MVTIFFFSNDPAPTSTKKSNSLIVNIAEKFIGRELTNKEKKKYVDKYDFIVRKAAHLSIYLLLGILLISYLTEYNLNDKKLIIYSIVIALLYACSDEIHQIFVPGRSGEIRDIIIDTIGSTVGVFIYFMFYKHWRKKHE